jgi:hypothetical protein
MHFRILGPLEVEDGPRTLRLAGHQQRALLALLLLRANEVVPVDEIIEDLWGAEPPTSATKASTRSSRSSAEGSRTEPTAETRARPRTASCLPVLTVTC